MRDNYLEEYYSFLRFPSVSTDDKYKEKLVECANWLVNKLNRIGLQTQLVPTKRHPIVWARNEHRPGRPTVLIYGHYDVQPPDPLELWDSPPFQRIRRLHIVMAIDRKSTRLNSSHVRISYAVFCLKKKKGVSAAVQGEVVANFTVRVDVLGGIAEIVSEA